MIERVVRFCTRRESRAVWFTLDSIVDLDPAALKAAGIEGVLVDVDATLVAHHVRAFPPAVFAVLDRIEAAGLKVAIFSNARDLDTLRSLGVPVIAGVPRKPALAGFRAAVSALGLADPARVVMIGDNLLTDGAAVDAGLRFVWCRPIPGREPLGHRWARAAAERLTFGWRVTPGN